MQHPRRTPAALAVSAVATISLSAFLLAVFGTAGDRTRAADRPEKAAPPSSPEVSYKSLLKNVPELS